MNEATTLQEWLLENTSKNCKKCEEDKKTLQDDEEREGEYFFPTSCSKCHTESLVLDGNLEFSELFTYFYIPIARDCAQTGTIVAQKRKPTNTVGGYKKCAEKIKGCEADKDCQNTYDMFNSCLTEKDQCKSASALFGSLKDTDKFPYEYLVCKESCKDTTNDEFARIQREMEKCEIEQDDGGDKPDPSEDGERQPFTYQQYHTCVQQNVASCQRDLKDCTKDI